MSDKTITKKNKKKKIMYLEADRCKGCGFCVEFCPTEALAISYEFNSKGYHPPFMKEPDNCTICGLCALYCPDFAIHVEKVEDDNENKS